MATHYPVVFEQEDSGVYNVYVAGLPVYAQGATRGRAARAAGRTLTIPRPIRRTIASGGADSQGTDPDTRSRPPKGTSDHRRGIERL